MKKILIIGQGNIGTFLGATLQKGGHQITHLVKSLDQTKKSVNLQFTDRRHKNHRVKKKSSYTYKTISLNDKIKDYQYIIVPVSHNHLREVIQSISPFLKSSQSIVIMGNVWEDFDRLNKEICVPYLFAFPNFGGVIINDSLQGWLTPNFTTGITNNISADALLKFNTILTNIGFSPKIEKNIKGWLLTHFAYNGGMLLEAANKDGFRSLTKSWKNLKTMFLTMRECMSIVKSLGVNPTQFADGKSVASNLWWNIIKTRLMFSLPGMVKSADASKDLKEWRSYARKILTTARENNISTPLLNQALSL